MSFPPQIRIPLGLAPIQIPAVQPRKRPAVNLPDSPHKKQCTEMPRPEAHPIAEKPPLKLGRRVSFRESYRHRVYIKGEIMGGEKDLIIVKRNEILKK